MTLEYYIPETLSQVDPTLRGIYKITCAYNQKIYVGSTCAGFLSRWRRHLLDLRKNCHDSKTMQNAVNKYGVGTLQFSILEVLQDSEASEIFKREQFYLDTLKPHFNYNKKATGGSQGMTEEQKLRNREILRTAPPRSDNTSGVKGITYFPLVNKQKLDILDRWVVSIGTHGHKINIGCFYDFGEAKLARSLAEVKFFSPDFDSMPTESRNILVKELREDKQKLYAYINLTDDLMLKSLELRGKR